jgi:hypothetical protein
MHAECNVTIIFNSKSFSPSGDLWTEIMKKLSLDGSLTRILLAPLRRTNELFIQRASAIVGKYGPVLVTCAPPPSLYPSLFPLPLPVVRLPAVVLPGVAQDRQLHCCAICVLPSKSILICHAVLRKDAITALFPTKMWPRGGLCLPPWVAPACYKSRYPPGTIACV